MVVLCYLDSDTHSEINLAAGGVSGLAGSTQLQSLAFLTILFPIYQLIKHLYQINKNLKFDPKQYGLNKQKGSKVCLCLLCGLLSLIPVVSTCNAADGLSIKTNCNVRCYIKDPIILLSKKIKN